MSGRNGATAADRASRLITQLCEARGFDEYAPIARKLAQLSEAELGTSQENGASAARYEGRVLDVAAMLAAPDEPIPWRCERLAADGYLTVLAGRGGEGKSLLALSLACGVAGGRPAAGVDCRAGSALIFDAENGPRLIARRFRSAGITASTAVQPVEAGGLHLRKDLDWFRSVIAEQQADLVVFDSLRVLSSGAKENDADEMEPLITQLKELARDTQAAILLIHHRGKSELSEFRGSAVILDQTDMLFTLGRVANDPDARVRRKITTIKCRIEEEPPPRWVRIEVDRPRGLVYVDDAEPFEEGDAKPRDERRDQVVQVLDDTPRSERRIAELTGVARSTLQRLLGDLEVEGLAARGPDGNRWVAHRPVPLGTATGGPSPESGSAKGDTGGPSDGEAGRLWATAADVGLEPRCSCSEPGELAIDGRCSRCWGWPPEDAP